MKKLKNLSAFKIIVLILINIFLCNKYLLILSLIYLLINSKKSLLVFVALFSICCITNNYLNDFLSYGIVEETYSSYIVVNKILYKNKVYVDSVYEVGEIVKTNKGIKIEDSSQLKYNYRFINYEEPKLIFTKTPCYLLNKCIAEKDTNIRNYLKNIINNTYDVDADIEYLGYGFTFYFLLILVKQKNKYLCLGLLTLYTIFIRFDLKFFIILGDIISENLKLNKLSKLSFKISLILIINKYLLLNKAILISLLFTYLNFSLGKDKSTFIICQSLFFNQISIGLLFFYKYYVYVRISLFIFSLLVIIFPVLGQAYLSYIGLSSKIIKILTISIRGKYNFLVLIIYFLIIKFFKIKHKFIKYILLILLLIVPINNPVQHLNFIDVGQGNATLIHGALGKYNVLVDTGSKYNYSKLKNTLYGEGIYTLDYVIISHEDEDHSGNLENLKEDFNVNNIITIGEDISLDGCKLKYLNLGTYDNDNDNSLVYLVMMDDREILLPGDASKKVENIIVNKYGVRNIDILDIGHHGSNTSSSSYFIGSLNPEYIIISTNGKYGHPHEETIKTLTSYKLDYLITKEEGSIKFYLTKYFDLCITSKRIEIF